MRLKRLTKADQSTLKQINSLLFQLSTSGRQATLADLKKVIADKGTRVLTLVDGKKIIGMATLMTALRVSGIHGEMQDVVVDAAYRGQGLGEKLMKAIIVEARKMKVKKLWLDSRPMRVAANKLYQKLGFQPKETNVYWLKL